MNSAEQELPFQTAAASVPKLSIADLMIWTACVAVFLTILQWIFYEESPELTFIRFKLQSIAFSILWGTASAACIHWARNRRGWIEYGKYEPGHLFNVLVTFSGITTLLIFLFMNHFPFFYDWSIEAASLFLTTISILTICLIFISLLKLPPTRWILAPLPWLMIECFLLIENSSLMIPDKITELYYPIFYQWRIIPLLASFVGILFTLCLMVSEYWRKEKRDWLHWVGVFCMLGFYLVSIMRST